MRLVPTTTSSAGVLLIALAIIIPQHVNADSDSLDPVEHHREQIRPVCEQKEVSDFFNCIDSYKERLKKRATINVRELEACSVTRKNCLTACKSEPNCSKEKCPTCPTMQLVEGQKKIIVEGENMSYKYEMPILPSQNITTIIQLTNLINNTNIVDIPTNVNSTNINNIHIYTNETSNTDGEFGLGYSKSGSCCFAVQPKVCSASSIGLRCHHKRHKTCGLQCTSRIIHAQSRQRCIRGNGCQYRIGYVPQPRQPQCVYTEKWPHVSCGGRHQQTCDGCYDHYGYGAAKYYSGGRYPIHCTGCYDDGFDIGPLYRRGPVFQPFNYHRPPCYLTGTCYMPMCNYYGCYGHEYVDPAFGYPEYPQVPVPYYSNNMDFYGNDIMFFNEIDGNSRNRSNATNDEAEGNASWGVATYKCKVVGDDGVTHIQNCTTDELENNPFAGSPADYPHYPYYPYYPYYPSQQNESPGYELSSESRSSGDRARETEDGNRFSNPRQDMTAANAPRGRAHRKRYATHKRRKVQIVYDE